MAQKPSTMDMDMDNDIVRGRSTSSTRNRSRESSILLNTSSMAYHEWMEVMNNLLPDDAQAPVNSSQLFYASNYPKIEKGK